MSLELWNSVQTTDPKYTKSFSRAGGFSGTAINATYQIKRATEKWGPIGGKWGYKVLDSEFVPGHQGTVVHVLRVEFRHPEGVFEAFGQTTFCGTNKNGPYTDEEAPKKSLTDAITKALAMLGFSADVHLGMYDDNKYVNDLKNAKESSKVLPTKTGWEPNEEELAYLNERHSMVRDCLDNNRIGDVKAIFDGLDEEEKLWIWNQLSKEDKKAIKA